MKFEFRSRLSATVLSACGAAILAAGASAQRGTAVYELTFQSTWSAQTHPIDFPSFPHYSSLIGATHDATVSFWDSGSIASPGIEAMAERGATSTLTAEVNQAIQKGAANRVVTGPGLGVSPGSTKTRITIDATHPRLTLVTMLAPSPDWFVGVSGLDLTKNGQWIDQITVPLHVYDAGTDSGPTYTSPDMDTQPREKIAIITTKSGPFLNAPTIVGSFVIRRLAETRVYGCGVNPMGSFEVTGMPILGQSVRFTVDDPLRSISSGSIPLLLFAANATAQYPCGISVAGLGLGPIGSKGEVLIGAPLLTVVGQPWRTSPVPFDVPIPTQAMLVGARAYVQGLFVDGSRLAVTDAATVLIGN
ncbi:MAG: spondin domain-containing protein [Planctomycetes bacterium]|nr:spondin domain-containing protein [Planctomycetota bacterium]